MVKADPVCSTMPVFVVLSRMRTAGTPKIVRSLSVSTINMESVNVPVPRPEDHINRLKKTFS